MNKDILEVFDEKFPIQHHECDDCWYSCPKASDGCCDESVSDECNCGAERKHEELRDFIMKALQKKESEIIRKIKMQITKEINIAHSENQPTSRLTSLYMFISKLK